MNRKSSTKIVKYERANTKTRRIPNFGGRKELHDASTDDIRNALALLEYLNRCHRSIAVIPGVRSALKSTPKIGFHCYDPAYRFVDNYLFEAKCWFEQRISFKKTTVSEL